MTMRSRGISRRPRDARRPLNRILAVLAICCIAASYVSAVYAASHTRLYAVGLALAAGGLIVALVLVVRVPRWHSVVLVLVAAAIMAINLIEIGFYVLFSWAN